MTGAASRATGTGGVSEMHIQHHRLRFYRRLAGFAAALLLALPATVLAHDVDGKFGVGFEETLTGVGARQGFALPELRAAGLSLRYYVGNLGLELITGGGLHFPDGERTQAAAFASVGVLYNLFRAPSVNLAVGLRGLVGWARLTCPTTDDDQKTCANGRFGIAFEAPLRVEYFFAPSFSVAGAVGPVVGLNEPDGNPLTGERNSRSVSLTRGEFSGGLGFSYYFF